MPRATQRSTATASASRSGCLGSCRARCAEFRVTDMPLTLCALACHPRVCSPGCNPMCPSLLPHVLQPATLCDAGAPPSTGTARQRRTPPRRTTRGAACPKAQPSLAVLPQLPPGAASGATSATRPGLFPPPPLALRTTLFLPPPPALALQVALTPPLALALAAARHASHLVPPSATPRWWRASPGSEPLPIPCFKSARYEPYVVPPSHMRPGCNPVYPRPQPCVPQAATLCGAACSPV